MASPALLALAMLGGCDVATIPTTASEGLGRPAVAARVQVEVEGLPPAIDAMRIDVSSLAIRRMRDRVWFPLITGVHSAEVTPESPTGTLAVVPLGADTYDRLEVVADGVSLQRQMTEHVAELDRDDATLALQWVLDRDVAMTLHIDYRADVELTAQHLDMVFAPLARLD